MAKTSSLNTTHVISFRVSQEEKRIIDDIVRECGINITTIFRSSIDVIGKISIGKATEKNKCGC